MDSASTHCPPRATVALRPIDALAWAALATLLVAFVAECRHLGLNFPIPWPDEGSFLWPALAFRDHLRLLAPELDPSRDLFWMPPGFMVLEGLLFKIVPFSLGAARLFSALFFCGALACVARFPPGSRARLASVFVLAVFASSPLFVMVGNVARMESLVLLLTTAGFLLLHHRRGVGLAALAMAPLVHPNGAFALAGGALFYATTWRQRRVLSRSDIALLVASAFAWALYIAYVARNEAAFLTDIGNQLRFKNAVAAGEGGSAGRLLEPVVWIPATLLVVAGVAARKTGSRVGALSMLAAVFLGQTVVTAGWMYEIYPAFAALLSSIAVLVVADAALERAPWSVSRRAAALAGVCSALAACDAYLVFRNAFVLRSVDRAHSLSELPARPPVYFTADDHRVIAQRLTSIASVRGHVRVQFVPDSDALLFEELRSPRIGYVEQTFVQSQAEILVVHESVWFPRFMLEIELVHLITLNGPELSGTETIRERDGSERWTLAQWRH